METKIHEATPHAHSTQCMVGTPGRRQAFDRAADIHLRLRLSTGWKRQQPSDGESHAVTRSTAGESDQQGAASEGPNGVTRNTGRIVAPSKNRVNRLHRYSRNPGLEYSTGDIKPADSLRDGWEKAGPQGMP